VSENFNLVGVINQPKKKYYKESLYKTPFMRRHFRLLAEAEEKWLGSAGLKTKKMGLECEQYQTGDINTSEVLNWAKEKKPDLILLFGTRVLDCTWLNSFNNIINLHLGLSPYYRGSATLFWPFVDEQLYCIGTTLHLAVKNVDAGPILSRVRPIIKPGDSYYDINYKAIKAGIDDVPNTVRDYINKKISAEPQGKEKFRRSYKKRDFNERKLKQVLEYVGTGITEAQICKARKVSECKFSQ